MSQMQCVFFVGIMKIQILCKQMSVLAPEPHRSEITDHKSLSQLPGSALAE